MLFYFLKIIFAFQITFRTEIHINNVVLFFKNYFWYQHIKTILKVQTELNFSKKKKIEFEQNTVLILNAMPNSVQMIHT